MLFTLLLAPAVLSWTPHVGDKAAYAITATIDSTAAPAPIEVSGSFTEEIHRVDATEAVAQASGTLSASMNGSVREMDYPFRETERRLDGAVLSVDDGGSDPKAGGYRHCRMDVLVFPKKPVTLGDSWSVDLPGDEKAHIPGLHASYTLKGEEHVGKWDTWRIALKSNETGDGKAWAEGTVWIEKSTGILVHLHDKMTDVPSPLPQGAFDSGEWDTLRQP